MKNKKLNNFVKNHSHFFWYVKDLEKLSKQSIVENTLNYGDFNDVKNLINILGIKNTAKIFYKGANKKRSNYQPQIKNYFNLYFDKYA